MAKLIIPEILAKVTNLETQVFNINAKNIKELLKKSSINIPVLAEHFFYENGAFKEHFIIILNDSIVSLNHEIAETDEVELMIATAGGCDNTIELSREEIQRYARHLSLPNIGQTGQKKIKNAKVIVIG